MKQIIIILLLLISSFPVFAQVQDGFFEQWDTVYHSMYQINGIFEIVPSVWKSNNEPNPDWSLTAFSTPATRYEESPIDEFSLKLESKALALDAWYSGELYQDISLQDLSQISFLAKCDSLSQNSGCFIEIFGIQQNESLELIYQDSIIEEEEFFSNYLIDVGSFTSSNFDSIRLQFRAKGAGGFEDEHLIGHTTFLIDGVESKYLTNTIDLKSDLILRPNPVSQYFEINSSDQNINKIVVYDFIGNMHSVSKCFSKNCIIDMNELNKGMYNVLIEFENGTKRLEKVIKTKY